MLHNLRLSRGKRLEYEISPLRVNIYQLLQTDPTSNDSAHTKIFNGCVTLLQKRYQSLLPAWNPKQFSVTEVANLFDTLPEFCWTKSIAMRFIDGNLVEQVRDWEMFLWSI